MQTFVSRRRLIVIIPLLLILGIAFFGLAQPTTASPPQQASYYTVQAGDTWSGIAASFSVPARVIWQANGVTSLTTLAEGQRLFIPAAAVNQQNVVLTYQAPSAVAALRVAVESGNSVASMLLYNAAASPAELAGLRIDVPNRQAAIAAVARAETSQPEPPSPTIPTQEPTPLPEPSPTLATGGALNSSLMGVQGHFMLDDEELRGRLLDIVAYDVGFGWVKQQVAWSEFEYRKDQYSDVMMNTLDLVVDDASNRGMNVMLSIAKAPDWARSTTEEDGPPIDYAEYAEFVRDLMGRYKGKVQAIEIWNEPNLRREWNGGTLSGAEYVQLLALGYEAVKNTYPEGNVIVVSAGLAPTGVNDGINAIDDRTYLRQMYEAGVANYADAIGIHPYSWGNPPWTRCCGDWGGAPSHNDHPSFFFLDTIEDYRAIQAEYGDEARPLWATEFGWGTMDKLNRPFPEDAPFFNYLNEDLQAQYIVEAYRMAEQWDFMGPMFLWNFNVAALPGSDDNQSGYSILRANDDPRRAYQVLRDTPKTDS